MASRSLATRARRTTLRGRLVRTARKVVVPLAEAWVDRAAARAAARAAPRIRGLAAQRGSASRPIRFLITNAWGIGGTIRTTFNTAGYLSRTRDVEVVSVLRNVAEPGIAPPPGLRIRSLFDGTNRRWTPRTLLAVLLRRRPSRLWHDADGAYRHASLWTDVLLLRWLGSLAPGTVVIATRPALIILAARLAPRGVTVIGQEHQRLDHHPARLLHDMAAALENASLMLTLTETDRRAFAKLLGPGGPPVAAIPNAVPPAVLGPGNPDARTIIAAGRLAHQKGFDILLRAFADLAPRHPGWTLEIYGRGGKREALEALLHQLGLENWARINPPTDRLGERMRDASIYALSSRYEGFPLVLLEAMAAGLAVVAFDCPTGPNEIVTDGRTGLLVPAEDVEAFTSALDRVMTNASLRRRLARTAPRHPA